MRKRPLGTICVLSIIIQILLAAAGVRGKVPVPAAGEDGLSISAAGQVYQRETRQDYQILYIKDAEMPHQNSSELQFNMIVYDKEFVPVSLGNRVKTEGRISLFDAPRNPGNYNQKFYYEKRGISFAVFADTTEVISDDGWRIRECLAVLRERWSELFVHTLGERNGGMLNAMILGDRSGLDRDWKELYQINGIGHLLAISGLHLSFIGLCVYRGFRKLGFSYAMAGGIGIVFLSLYAVLTGLSVSAMRALIMFIIRIGADISGRVYDMLTSLLAAAAVIICMNPLYAFDAGFLFSFGAILGILFLLPILKMIFGCPLKWMEGILASLAIQIFLFPVTLYFFFEIPLYSVLLNVIAIPLMPFVLGAGLVGTAVHMPAPGAGKAVLRCAGHIFSLYDKLCEWCLALPLSRIVAGKPRWYQVAVWYVLLMIFIYCMGKGMSENEKNLQKRKRCGAAVILFMIFCIAFPWRWNAGTIEVTMLDVGQGDGIYMRGPSGVHYFVDGGSSDVKEAGRYRIEPFLKSRGVKKLDYVFISHGDGDHTSGIKEMLARQAIGIRIETLVMPMQEAWDDALWELAQAARENETKVVVMKEGQELTEKAPFGDKMLSIRCLHPGADYTGEAGNGGSMVLKLAYGEFDMLLTGDLEGEGERLLTKSRRLGSVDVLKVAHHGSKNSTAEAFLDRTEPKTALISAGKGNSYGHPHKETLERLEGHGVKVYSTQDKGAVTIKTNGRKVEIEGYKNS